MLPDRFSKFGLGDGESVPYIFGSKPRVLPSYFRDSSTATATETVAPTMGEQCAALRVRSRSLPVAGCHYAMVGEGV